MAAVAVFNLLPLVFFSIYRLFLLFVCVCVCPAVTFRHDPPPRLPEKGKMSPLPPPPPPPPMIYERRHGRRSFSSIQWLLFLFQYFSMKYFSECENGCSHPVSSSSSPPSSQATHLANYSVINGIFRFFRKSSAFRISSAPTELTRETLFLFLF